MRCFLIKMAHFLIWSGPLNVESRKRRYTEKKGDTKMTRMNRKYDKAFKFEAIQLYETNGKSVSQIETEVFPKYADPLQSGSVRYVAHNEILAVHYEKFPYATIPRK